MIRRRAERFGRPDVPAPDVLAPDVLAIVLIAVLWLAMGLIANPAGDFPVNDDWMFGGSVTSLLAGNGLRVAGAFHGIIVPPLLTQVVWGAAFCLPFGYSYTALRVSTLVLGLIGLALFFALLRENGISRRLALVTTFALAVNPLYFGLSETFMTDVPLVVLMIVSLYLLTRSIRENSTSFLVAGVIVSFVAILTRQVGFAPLLGYAVANA